ncbi:hypothetical protein MA13_contig00001-0313 [Edwardsiella piscicida]|nr:hypothetical protein MA13_contig00001-0313 [Edwardsiella piscicida]
MADGSDTHHPGEVSVNYHYRLATDIRIIPSVIVLSEMIEIHAALLLESNLQIMQPLYIQGKLI